MKIFATILALGLAAASVDAAVIPWTATLAPENEVPPVSSTGSGTGSGVLDTNTGDFTWSIEWTGLTGPAIGVHFHGTAAPDENAAVIVNVTALSGTIPPVTGSTVLSGSQIAEVLAGLWYINVHTEAYRSGEIRGQVAARISAVPVPATLPLLLGAGLLLGALRIRGTRRGRPM